MITVGNALAPRWYDNNPRKLDRFLDIAQQAGATAMEVVLHPGDVTPEQGDVQIPEEQWDEVVDILLQRGLLVSIHGPLDRSLSLREWHQNQPRLIATYARLLRFAARTAERQGEPVPLVMHASRSPLRNETENAADTADFLHWALELTAESAPVLFALELRDTPEEESRWFDADRFSLLRFVRQIESDRVGICWDMGHDWQNLVRLRESLDPPTQAFLDNVVHVHTHDGKSDQTVHHPVGAGKIPIDRWLRTLSTSGYAGQLTLELRYRHARQAGEPWAMLADSYQHVLRVLNDGQQEYKEKETR